MKTKIIILGILSSIALNANAQEVSDELLELAPNSSHMSVFNTYCLEDTDAFNIASNLVADGWISYDDIDLIKNPQYKELFEEYSKTIISSSQGDIDVYTRELRNGVVFTSIHDEFSGCSIMPLSNYTTDDMLGYLADRNVSTMSISNSRQNGANVSYHLYGSKVISIVERENDSEALSHIMSMHLDANVSSAMPEITKELNQPNTQP